MSIPVRQAAASDLFTAEAITTDELSRLRLNEGSSDVLDLVDDLLDANGRFDALEGRSYTASLDYAGVDNAFIFTSNSEGTETRLRIPLTGFDKVFRGNTRSETTDEITDFLKKDGEEEYKKFLDALRGRSLVLPTDGNPQSATARAAAVTFDEFGSVSGSTDDRGIHGGVSATVEAAKFSAGDFEGESYVLPLALKFKLSEQVGLVFNAPLGWITIEDADIYTAGLSASLPVLISKTNVGEPSPAPALDTSKDGGKAVAATISPEKPNPWTWMLTPTFGAIATGSEQYAAGGLIGHASLTSALAYSWPSLTLSLGNYIGYLESIAVEGGDYTFDPGVTQAIFKGGLKASYRLSDIWLLEGYGIYTRFIDDAAVQEYFTVGAEIGWKIPTTGSQLKLGVYGEFGSDYSAGSIRLGSRWKF